MSKFLVAVLAAGAAAAAGYVASQFIKGKNSANDYDDDDMYDDVCDANAENCAKLWDIDIEEIVAISILGLEEVPKLIMDSIKK